MAPKSDPARTVELEASKKAAMAALEKLIEAKDHFRQAAEAAGLDLKAEAIDQLAKGKVKTEELSSQAADYVQDKPLQALGLAILGGFILAQLLSRK